MEHPDSDSGCFLPCKGSDHSMQSRAPKILDPINHNFNHPIIVFESSKKDCCMGLNRHSHFFLLDLNPHELSLTSPSSWRVYHSTTRAYFHLFRRCNLGQMTLPVNASPYQQTVAQCYLPSSMTFLWSISLIELELHQR